MHIVQGAPLRGRLAQGSKIEQSAKYTGRSLMLWHRCRGRLAKVNSLVVQEKARMVYDVVEWATPKCQELSGAGQSMPGSTHVKQRSRQTVVNVNSSRLCIVETRTSCASCDKLRTQKPSAALLCAAEPRVGCAFLVTLMWHF